MNIKINSKDLFRKHLPYKGTTDTKHLYTQANLGCCCHMCQIQFAFSLIRAGIQNMKYMGGGTNTADAIRYMRENMFTQSSGARPNVPRIGKTLRKNIIIWDFTILIRRRNECDTT